MKKVIIAEKPSLAKNIIAAIGSKTFKREDGYFENDEYIVTWAFGHLFELRSMDAYSPDYDPENKPKWTLDNLPFIPSAFMFDLKKGPDKVSPDAGVKKQYNTICKLIKRKDVFSIVNAGDSDREGEIIVRIILEQANNKKPVERLWMPDQTPETIRDELINTRKDDEYNNLADEGYARTYIDWLYGINLSRYATLKAYTLLRVGRVISPMVYAIYERDMTIKNFVPVKYYSITSSTKVNGEGVVLTSKKTFDANSLSLAQELCDKYNLDRPVVANVSRTEKIIGPGKLYSLSKLQGYMGRTAHMTPQATLDNVQSLYEGGYVSYPRTNTEYLSVNEKDKIKALLNSFAEDGVPVAFRDSSSIFDDSKIESHSALVPTRKSPEKFKNDDEKKVYEAIYNRFCAVFCSTKCIADHSVITIKNKDETFSLVGDIIKSKGWLMFGDGEKKDKVLPNLAAGDVIDVNFKPVAKETQPPKHYTVESFGRFLKNPFAKEKNDDDEFSDSPASVDVSDEIESDDEEYKAVLSGAELGTEATRAGLIDSAIRSKYISLNNNIYTITPDGKYYVNALESLKIDMTKDKTVSMGMQLKKIYRGEISINDGVDMAYKEVSETISHKDEVSVPRKNAFDSAEELCTCPKCGKRIMVLPSRYICENPDCGIVIYKDDKFFAHFSKTVPKALAKILFTKGKASVKKLVSSKTGKPFDATIRVSFEGKYPKYDMEFEENKPFCKCPRCGGDIMNRQSGYFCSNKECGVAIWKDNSFFKAIGAKLTTQVAMDFFTKGQHHFKDLYSEKKDKKYDATICVSFKEGKTEFSFVQR